MRTASAADCEVMSPGTRRAEESQAQDRIKASTSCACQYFGAINLSLSAIVEALESPDFAVHGLLQWLSGDFLPASARHQRQNPPRVDSRGSSAQHQSFNSTGTTTLPCGSTKSTNSCGWPCRNRGNAALCILNAIRDACRPMLHAATKISPAAIATTPQANRSTDTTARDQRSDPLSQQVAATTSTRHSSLFSSLVTNGSTTNTPFETRNNQHLRQQPVHAIPSKRKRRIRPALVASSRVAATTTTLSAPPHHLGNLVNAPPLLDFDASFAGLRLNEPILMPSAETMPSSVWSPSTPPIYTSPTETSRIAPKSSQSEAPPFAPMNPETKSNSANHSHLQASSTLLESSEQLESNLALNRLVEVYFTLIQASMVPSSVLELHFILRILSCTLHDDQFAKIPHRMEDAPDPINSSSVNPLVDSVLSTTQRCRYFAQQVLLRLQPLILSLGPVVWKAILDMQLLDICHPELSAALRSMWRRQQDETKGWFVSSPPAGNGLRWSSREVALLTVPFQQ